MTLDRLHSLVLRLANQGLCRWWNHLNYPQHAGNTTGAVWQMAIEFHFNGNPARLIAELRALPGFLKIEEHTGHIFVTYERVDDAGQPFTTTLY